MSTSEEPEATEAELRAALEEEMKRVRVEDLVLQSVVSILNLGIRRAGLPPGTEGECDWDQVRIAVDAVRGLGPVIEQAAPAQAGAIRDALAQLQMAYVRERGAGAPPAAGPPGGGGVEPAPGRPAPSPGGEKAGPAQSSGRLWVPGQ